MRSPSKGEKCDEEQMEGNPAVFGGGDSGLDLGKEVFGDRGARVRDPRGNDPDHTVAGKGGVRRRHQVGVEEDPSVRGRAPRLRIEPFGRPEDGTGVASRHPHDDYGFAAHGVSAP